MIWLVLILNLLTLAALVAALVLRYRVQDKADHAKCIAHVASVTSNRIIALAFRDAADRWDSIEEQADLNRLAREKYKVGGPSMPAIWMRERANKIEVGA